jgi:MFS family permease
VTEAAARDRSALAVADAPDTEEILRGETGAPESKGGTFRSLKYRDYRLLWFSTLFASSAQWIQQVTIGWLIYEMTESAFLLGAVNGFRALPLLFLAPIGGVLADRVERKMLMQATQYMLLVASAIMTAIIFAGWIEVWHLFAFTFITGIGWALNNPVRQSVVPNLVPKYDLMNALALQSAGFNITRILGPTLGGYMLAHLGAGENFSLQTFFYVGVIAMVIPVVIPRLPRRNESVSVRQNLKDGISYVWRTKQLRVQLALAFVPTILAFPYMALMPIFARDVLGYGSEGLGLMGTAVGVGAVIGTLTMASLNNVQNKGKIMLSAVFLLGISLMAFSQSKSMELSLVILAFTGASQMVYLTTNQTILQLSIPDHLRGRVMGIYMLSQGMMPLGGLVGGAFADATSAPTAVLVMGALVCAMAAFFFVRAPDLREA